MDNKTQEEASSNTENMETESAESENVMGNGTSMNDFTAVCYFLDFLLLF